MKAFREIYVCGVFILTFVISSKEARAINVPDINSACSANVQTDCFKVTHNNTSSSPLNAVVGNALGGGAGVQGTSATGFGVIGKTNVTFNNGSFAVLGQASSAGGGVEGLASSGVGVWGNSTSNTGVAGNTLGAFPVAGVAGRGKPSGNGLGVYGAANGSNSIGVFGEVTGTNAMGIRAKTDAGYGVYAVATSGIGVYGSSSTNAGLYGNSGSGLGVYGQSTSNAAIYGISQDGNGGSFISSTSYGVYGSSTSGFGVLGTSSSNIALYGLSSSSHGLYAQSDSPSARGVFGYNSSGGGVGIWGESVGESVAIQGENTDASGWAGYFDGNLGVTGVPRANQTTFSTLSDARLKKDVKPLEGALEKLLQLRGVTYEWKQPAEHGNLRGTQVGFIAQEVEKVFPSWVAPDPSGFKAVTTRGLEAMVVESLRSLQAQNDELRARVKALEANRGPAKASLGLGEWHSAASLLIVTGVLVFAGRRRSRKTDA